MRLIDNDLLFSKIANICSICARSESLKFDYSKCISCKINELNKLLDVIPSIDAEPVRHGHWIPVLIPTGVSAFGVDEMTVEEEKCSVCGKTYWVGVEKNFCPNCGAKMDEVIK